MIAFPENVTGALIPSKVTQKRSLILERDHIPQNFKGELEATFWNPTEENIYIKKGFGYSWANLNYILLVSGEEIFGVQLTMVPDPSSIQFQHRAFGLCWPPEDDPCYFSDKK